MYLEECVVTAQAELTGGLYVVVDLPEILDGVDSLEIVLVLFPRS